MHFLRFFGKIWYLVQPQIAKKHRVDPRRLIVELCKHDKINASEELLVKLAQELQISMVNMPNIQMGNYFGQEESIS